LKRFLVVAPLIVALTAVLGTATASAKLTVEKTTAKPGDSVEFKIDELSDGDIWELRVADGDASTDSWIMDGVADGVTEVTDKFDMPNLGGADKDVRLRLYIGGNGRDAFTVPNDTFIAELSYVAPPDNGGGSTGGGGPTGGGGTSTPTVAAGATAVTGGSGTTGSSKSKSNSNSKSKKESSSKKKSDSGNSKKKSGGGKKSPSSTPVTTPVTPAPIAAAPVVTDSAPSADPPAQTTVPDAPPPGVGGPPSGGGGDLAPPGDVPPSSPPAQAPIAPVSTTSSGDNDAFGIPIGLVLLLGLLTLVGLGGAQARMLGLWGPPAPLATNGDPRDARLLALSRVAQSGANLQKKIAEHKLQAKERQPLN
jgi:hypothetical protein